MKTRIKEHFLDPRPWPEASYEFGSVLLFVLLLGSFLGIGSLVSSETLYGVRGPYGDVHDRSYFVWKKPKVVKNAPKIGFLDLLGKSIH